MSDMQSMDREKKKRQLRQNIVQMPDNGSEEPMDGGRLAKYKRKKRIICTIIRILLDLSLFLLFMLMRSKHFKR